MKLAYLNNELYQYITYVLSYYSYCSSDTHSKSNQKEKCTNSDMSNNCDSSYLSLINELNDKVENVKKQKDDLNERLRKSEQEKEHWKVEYQLVQMKHDKLKNHMNGKLYKTNVHFPFYFSKS